MPTKSNLQSLFQVSLVLAGMLTKDNAQYQAFHM